MDSPLWQESTIALWHTHALRLHTYKLRQPEVIEISGEEIVLWFKTRWYEGDKWSGEASYRTREDARRNHDQILVNMGLLARRVSA